MAMGEARSGEQTRQIEMVALDDLVAGDDLYRRIEPEVSWAAIRAQATPYYAETGRPSVCPAVLMKLFLVCAIEGHGSMRATLDHAARDLAVRRFLGYGLGERLPHHSTLSYAQCVRFVNAPIFEQLFTQVLARCSKAGLLDGTRLVVDATHVEADAALRSLRAELTDASAPEGGPHEDAPAPVSAPAPRGRPELSVAAPRSGPTPARRASNATAVSLTDPDAKLRRKPGHRPHLCHRAQVATDPKARVIVAVAAERVTGHEAAALPAIVTRARWAGHRVDTLGADKGYASRAAYEALAGAGTIAYIPPQANMRRSDYGQAAYARCRSPEGVRLTIDRQAHAEGAIAELKLRHGMARARCRGTRKLQIQLLVAAVAVNLKRLATRDPDAPWLITLEVRLGAGFWRYEFSLN